MRQGYEVTAGRSMRNRSPRLQVVSSFSTLLGQQLVECEATDE